MHDGSAQPGIEIKANEDGSYDITLSKDYCGYAHPPRGGKERVG